MKFEAFRPGQPERPTLLADFTTSPPSLNTLASALVAEDNRGRHRVPGGWSTSPDNPHVVRSILTKYALKRAWRIVEEGFEVEEDDEVFGRFT